MASYAAIISLKLTLQKTLQHPSRYSIPCEKREIESLYEKFESLRWFLEEYPSRESNEYETSLERRIGDAACQAEYLMAIHLNNPSHSKDILSPVILISKARNYFRHLVAAFKNDTHELNPYKKEIMGRINIKAMIKKVDSLLDEVTKIKEQMGLEMIQGRGSLMEEEIKIGRFCSQQDCEPGNVLRQDSSKLTVSLMVGFDDRLKQIMDHFTGQSDALEVISIVGMGGIGKTTLATHVYNDPYVVSRFDVRAWATVSQSYSVRDIQLGMLDSMKILTKEMYRESDAKLGVRVFQYLKNRRYLITIDDIWDTDAWDGLKMMFPDDDNGSRIILTTRSANVAAYASPSEARHHISLLSDVQSWMLLRAKVFGDEPCPLNLQKIGMEIAHNCCGLPLSIVVIGGLLSKATRTQGAWQSIAANVTSSSADQCSDILRLSYNHLPQYLKACFLYMGAFPKSHEYRVSKITRMWVAEGFLGQIQGQSLEQVAERCVEDLVDRSLILMSKKNSMGKIKAFKIHDLVLDFCLKEAKSEKFLQTIKIWSDLLGSDLESERRIIIGPMKEFVHPIIPLNHRINLLKHILFGCDYSSISSYVRSLVCCLDECFFGSSVFLRLKLLIVLDAAEVEFLEFPYQVLELLNLRYIALRYDGHTPASITKLWNLQTLIILGDSWGFIKNRLPVDIWMMAHLRHVRCHGAYLFGSLAAKFDFYRKHLVLENLQTLTGLWNLRFSEEMLQSIPNIQKINVFYDIRLRKKKWPDYQLENLANLHQLKALKIRVISFREAYNYLNTSPMFKFGFPPSLKKLALGGVGIPWHDLAIIGSLPNLEVLKLFDRACLGTEWEPNEEEFPKLKVLTLQSLNLEHWRDSGHFPSLQCLIIRWCYGLVEIPSAMGESSTLTTIELEGCKDSVLNSAAEILEKQKSNDNDAFQVIYHKRSIWRNLAKHMQMPLPLFLVSNGFKYICRIMSLDPNASDIE